MCNLAFAPLTSAASDSAARNSGTKTDAASLVMQHVLSVLQTFRSNE